jgi:hypothetical protein
LIGDEAPTAGTRVTPWPAFGVMKTVVEILKEARAKISDTDHWRRHALTKDESGTMTYAACDLEGLRAGEEASILEDISTIRDVNDATGCEDTVRVFDRAIALAEEKK